MADIIQFPNRFHNSWTAEQAINKIITQLIEELIPQWVEEQLDFQLLDLLQMEMRAALNLYVNPTSRVSKTNLDVLMEELKPQWNHLVQEILARLQGS